MIFRSYCRSSSILKYNIGPVEPIFGLFHFLYELCSTLAFLGKELQHRSSGQLEFAPSFSTRQRPTNWRLEPEQYFLRTPNSIFTTKSGWRFGSWTMGMSGRTGRLLCAGFFVSILSDSNYRSWQRIYYIPNERLGISWHLLPSTRFAYIFWEFAFWVLEAEAISEDLLDNGGFCCCSVGPIPGLLSFNNNWALRFESQSLNLKPRF